MPLRYALGAVPSGSPELALRGDAPGPSQTATAKAIAGTHAPRTALALQTSCSLVVLKPCCKLESPMELLKTKGEHKTKNIRDSDISIIGLGRDLMLVFF